MPTPNLPQNFFGTAAADAALRRKPRSRTLCRALFAAAAVGLCAPAAMATTYVYVGQPYTQPEPTSVIPTSTPAGATPSPYTTAMKVVGQFTTAAPLAANLASQNIGPPTDDGYGGTNGNGLMLSWNWSDGVLTYNQSNSVFNYAGGANLVSTDASGNITSHSFLFVTPKSPFSVGQAVQTLYTNTLAGITREQVTYFTCNSAAASMPTSCYVNSNAPATISLRFAQVDTPGTWLSFDPQDDAGTVPAGQLSTLPSVAANDKVSGAAATMGASGNATVAQAGTWPAGITLDPATGAVTVASTVAAGNYPLTYSLCSSAVPDACATVNVTITVTPAAPVAANDAFTGPAQQKITGNVLTNDTPATGVTAVLQDAPKNGTLTLRPDGSFDYTPTGAFTGTDTFTYLVDGGAAGKSAVATVTLTITAVPQGATAQAVPTLGHAGLALLSGLVLGVGALRRRKPSAGGQNRQ